MGCRASTRNKPLPPTSSFASFLATRPTSAVFKNRLSPVLDLMRDLAYLDISVNGAPLAAEHQHALDQCAERGVVVPATSRRDLFQMQVQVERSLDPAVVTPSSRSWSPSRAFFRRRSQHRITTTLQNQLARTGHLPALYSLPSFLALEMDGSEPVKTA